MAAIDADAVRRNAEIGRQLGEDLWNRGDLDAVEKLYAEDVVIHAAGWPEEIRGHQACREYVETLRSGFSGLEATIDDVIADDTSVVTRYTFRGTHDGEVFGIEPTGRTVEGSGVCILHIEDGKIAEEWDFDDLFGMMQQLGVLEMPGA